MVADGLTSLSRRELQALAKQHGIKANAKSEDIIIALRDQEHGNAAGQAPRKPELGTEAAHPDSSAPLADVTDAFNRDQGAPPCTTMAADEAAGLTLTADDEARASAAEAQGTQPFPAKEDVAAPGSSAMPMPSSGQEFFQGLHVRVSNLIASSPSMRDPSIRKSFTNLSSTLLDAVIASRDGVHLPPPRDDGAFRFVSPPGGGASTFAFTGPESCEAGGGNVMDEVAQDPDAMVLDAPSPFGAASSAAPAVSFTSNPPSSGSSWQPMPAGSSSMSRESLNRGSGGVERANALRAAEAARLQGMSVSRLSSVTHSPSHLTGRSPTRPAQFPIQSPMRKLAPHKAMAEERKRKVAQANRAHKGQALHAARWR